MGRYSNVTPLEGYISFYRSQMSHLSQMVGFERKIDKTQNKCRISKYPEKLHWIYIGKCIVMYFIKGKWDSRWQFRAFLNQEVSMSQSVLSF